MWGDWWEFFLHLGQGEDEEGATTTRLNNHCKADVCIKGHDQYLWASNSKESVCGSKIHLRRIWGWWLWRSSPSLLCSPVGKTLQHKSLLKEWWIGSQGHPGCQMLDSSVFEVGRDNSLTHPYIVVAFLPLLVCSKNVAELWLPEQKSW